MISLILPLVEPFTIPIQDIWDSKAASDSWKELDTDNAPFFSQTLVYLDISLKNNSRAIYSAHP